MGRTVERLEGLALVGGATIGEIPLLVPGLLESRPAGGPATGPVLRSVDAPLGVRHLQISDGTRALDLEYAVPAPEVVGPLGGATPVGPHAVLVRTPLPRELQESVRTSHPDLLIWGNARAQWSEGRPFIEAIAQLRAAFGAEPLLWAPRIALPHRVPLLAYLGVDLVDSTAGLLDAARGMFLDGTLGTTDAAVARSEHHCSCPSCTASAPGPIEEHTAAVYRRAMAETRTAARTGRLRQLVESRLPSEPALAEMLRYADHDLGTLLEERTPVTGDDTLPYVLLEAHRRPEMVRFRQRLRTRYAPPPSKSVLLLVPCSRTKPYRLSRSHRRFYGALEGLFPVERVHVVSVSSPIGLVPRELEDVPPARHYDIPVTGEWEEREREAVVEGVRHLLAAGHYRSVVIHLDPAEYGFVRAAIPPDLPSAWTLGDHRTTSHEALASLRGAVGAALDGETPVAGGPLAVVREELREVAAVQIGRRRGPAVQRPGPPRRPTLVPATHRRTYRPCDAPRGARAVPRDRLGGPPPRTGPSALGRRRPDASPHRRPLRPRRPGRGPRDPPGRLGPAATERGARRCRGGGPSRAAHARAASRPRRPRAPPRPRTDRHVQDRRNP